MASRRSASAARQAGDSFQHLVAWNRILRALPLQRGLVSVELEAVSTGNADDVVIRSSTEPDEFTQVKYGVDLSRPINLAYLTGSSARGTSVLQKFYKTWVDLGGVAQHPNLNFVSNRAADATDAVLSLMDGLDSTLVQPLKRNDHARSDLSSQLKIDEDELLAFLGDLRFRLGCQYLNEEDHASSLMLANGLSFDPASVQSGIGLVRAWVLAGRRAITAEVVRQEIAALGLQAREPLATLMIDAIDHAPYSDDADEVLDWVRFYEGVTPATRRLATPSAYEVMYAELIAAATRLRASGHRRVLVRGAMRLSAWFVAGHVLSEVSGMAVTCGRPNQPWSSDSAAAAAAIAVDDIQIGAGDEAALVLAFAADPVDDVVRFIEKSQLPIGTVRRVAPHAGKRIQTSHDAAAYALAIKLAAREHVSRNNAARLNLFMAVPAGLALLTGHLWNRVGSTTVWEDDGHTDYTTAFAVPG